MHKRVLFAGVLGGIAMFVWSSVAHIVLPLGAAGIQEIPNEQSLLGPMGTTLGGTSGMYMFPAMGTAPDAMQQYEKKLASSPSGLLIYHPAGAKAMTPGQLVTEFLTEFLQALLAAFLLSQSRLNGFAARAGFVAVVGVVAAISTNVSYWNWYGFPATYTAAYMTIQLVGFVLIGLVCAAILRGRQAPDNATAARAA